jgi:5-methyltetrahydropteroyltriglutamate--homocysteine methyltransferase
MLGVLDLSTEEIERPDAIAAKLRAALEVVPAERLVAATDCGMKFLPRRVARGKLRAMAEGAAIVRAGL